MSAKERKRLELLSRVREGVLKLVEAAGLCQVSYRQMKRVWKRYREQSDAGLGHRGELIQMDGSHHDGWEQQEEGTVLMVMIDDATNRTCARFYEERDPVLPWTIFGR